MTHPQETPVIGRQPSTVCRICRSPQLRFAVDFGNLAITNQFVSEGGPAAFRQPMSWQECVRCGTVQLAEVPPVDQLRCRFPWLTYREPEGHLDELAMTIGRDFALKEDSRVIGFTKDDLPLMRRLGFQNSILPNPHDDLGISQTPFGVETIQSHLTVDICRQIALNYGKADLLIARYVLEHAQDGAEFLNACRELLNTGGLLVIEVPDSAQAFRDLDVTVLWDEHVFYFTEQTLKRSLQVAGFQLRQFHRIRDSMEDRLVWIGQAGTPTMNDVWVDLSEIDADLQHFQRGWLERRRLFRIWAENIQDSGGKLAVFGAGHRACTLIDATATSDCIDCIIDDTSEKQKVRFPAGELPIYGSAALVDRGITCCLLAVNPEVENRIIDRNAAFLAGKGTFVSCYPRSPRALRLS
jgi:hypothetical protein